MAIEKRECENCEAEYVVAGDDVYIGGYAKNAWEPLMWKESLAQL